MHRISIGSLENAPNGEGGEPATGFLLLRAESMVVVKLNFIDRSTIHRREVRPFWRYPPLGNQI